MFVALTPSPYAVALCYKYIYALKLEEWCADLRCLRCCIARRRLRECAISPNPILCSPWRWCGATPSL